MGQRTAAALHQASLVNVAAAAVVLVEFAVDGFAADAECFRSLGLVAAGVVEVASIACRSISSIDDGTVTSNVVVRPSLAARARSTLIRSCSWSAILLIVSGKSSNSICRPEAIITARSTAFSSSRTLPGHS